MVNSLRDGTLNAWLVKSGKDYNLKPLIVNGRWDLFITQLLGAISSIISPYKKIWRFFN